MNAVNRLYVLLYQIYHCYYYQTLLSKLPFVNLKAVT